MFKLLLMNLIVGISAFLINYRILRLDNFIDSLLALFVLYFSQIITTELILGIYGFLYLDNVILLNCALLVIVWFVSKKKESSFSLAGAREVLSGLLSNKIVLLATSLILGFAIVKIFINLIYPPFGWDNLSYHFVFPVEWLKHANLDTPITLCDDLSPSYYPINGSLFFLWFMLPLRNVFIADLGQVPFFIIAFISIYSICRKLGLSRELSFYASSLFLITPNVFKQLKMAYVDVMVAALFLAALNFLLALYREASFKNLILWSLYFGIFMGTKTSAVIYGIFPLVFFVCALLKNKNKLSAKKLIRYLILFIILTVILGGFAYLRNFIYTGNPLYPAEIKIFGKEVFKGVVPFSFYRDHWTRSDFNLEKLLFHEGLGVQFILLAIPAIFLSLPLILIRRKKDVNFNLIFISLLPTLLYLSFWLFLPQYWVRYLYPFLGVSYILAMYTLDLLNIPKRFIRAIVSICLLASALELSGHTELIISIILSVLFLVILPRILPLKLNLSFRLSLFILLAVTLAYLNSDYNKHEFDRYLSNSRFPAEDRQAWKWLDEHTNSSKIAYTGIPHVLPLYGTNFKNDVLYVSVNQKHPVKLHYFPGGSYPWFKDYFVFHKNLQKSGNYRENPSYPVWLSNLKSEKVDYLVAYSLRMIEERIVFPLEDEWALMHHELFNLAYKDNTVHIYKIIH